MKMVIYMILILSFLEFLFGTLLHFLYDFFPYPLIAILSPINESIFEHLKLLVYPMLLGYFILYGIKKPDIRKYMNAVVGGIISGLLTLVLIYYFVRYGLGIESLIFDIVLLLISIIVGNLVSYSIYRQSQGKTWKISIIVLIILIFLMILGTFQPLALPFFQEEKAAITLLQ